MNMRCGVIGTISPVAGNNNPPIAHIHTLHTYIENYICYLRLYHSAAPHTYVNVIIMSY